MLRDAGARSGPERSERRSRGTEPPTVYRSSHELFVLVMAFRQVHPLPQVRRAASWLLWRDGRLDELLGEASASGPDVGAVATALKLCHDAGIDVRTFAIWKDADRIGSVLPAGDLREWLTSSSGARAQPD